MRTIDHKRCSLSRAAKIVGISRKNLKLWAARKEIRCISADPWLFNIDHLMADIKARTEKILSDMRRKEK